jgi:hypothetical protein
MTSKGDNDKRKTVPKTVGAVDHSFGNRRRKGVGRKGRALIESLAAEGHSNTSIAKTLKMSSETLRQIRKRDPSVQECLDRGRASLEVELTHLLLQAAREGNVVAMIYLTKARCGWVEGQPPADTRPNITINLPASFSPAEYLARLRDADSGAPGAPGPGLLDSPETGEKD